MNCCCIPSCPKPANLACYNFPTDVQIRKKWLASINSDQHVLTITDQDILSICSLHFKQSDYIYLFCDDQSSKRKISEDAVPSIFPWTCDWDSNYTAEMEVVEMNGKFAQQTDSSQKVPYMGLPEGEAVQLGNVESLGINTRISTEDEICQENSTGHNDLNSVPDRGKLKNFLVTSIPSASFNHVMQLSTSTSNATSRIETSEDEDIKVFNILPAKIHYSCTDCEFKSSDIISLKDHRTKNHPYRSLSGSTSINQTINSCLGSNHYETLSQENHDSPNSSLLSGSVVRYRDKYGKRRNSYSCPHCPYLTKSSIRRLQEHISKNHSSSDISQAMTPYHCESNRPSPSSASCSMSDGPRPSKRYVRRWYLCSTCSFRTPNARKLKAHVKADHSDTQGVAENQATKSPTSKQNETAKNDFSLNIDFSDLKKLRLNGRTYYLCPGLNCSVRAKDVVYLQRHYQKDHCKSESEKLPESDTPNGKVFSPLKETDKLSLMASHQLGTKVENESMNNDDRKRYFCNLCKFSTVKKSNLKLHEVRHKNKSPYQCKMCSYSVEGSRQLAFHETNHHQAGFPCSLCDFKASTLKLRKRHEAKVHKVTSTARTAINPSQEPSDLDHDIEYSCSHCSFRTPSRERFVAHEKTHLPDIVESSTEELSIESDSRAIKLETSTRKLKRKRVESEGLSSSSEAVKMIERLVYQCPLCSYWARTVTNFHQHFIAHEKTPAFKCSKCDFSARYRSGVTRHIQNSSKKTHGDACWILIKTIPENQYPDYLKTAHVPECSYSGKSLTPTNSISKIEQLGTKPSNFSDSRSRTSSESLPESDSNGESEDESRDWIPSSSLSSADIKDNDSSSPSFVLTPNGSSENERETSSSSYSPTSDSKSEHSSENSTPSNARSFSTFTDGIVLRSSMKKSSSLRRKRLRIESNESDEETEKLPKSEVTAHIASPLKHTEDTMQSIADQKLEIKIMLKIPSRFPKGPFSVLEDALAKRQKDEQKISELQQKIKRMTSKQEKMKETDVLSQSELLNLKGKKNIVNKQIMKLNGQKIEAELQVRTQQCQELKLSLAMYDPEQQAETNTEALAEIKKLVAELEVKLTLITKDITILQEENEDLDRQIKGAEESHAGAAQLFEILQCELSEKELELTSLQEALAGSNDQIMELVNNERKEITAVYETFEEELKKAYMRGLSKIRDKERDMLNALEEFVKEKPDTPNIDETV